MRDHIDSLSKTQHLLQESDVSRSALLQEVALAQSSQSDTLKKTVLPTLDQLKGEYAKFNQTLTELHVLEDNFTRFQQDVQVSSLQVSEKCHSHESELLRLSDFMTTQQHVVNKTFLLHDKARQDLHTLLEQRLDEALRQSTHDMATSLQVHRAELQIESKNEVDMFCRNLEAHKQDVSSRLEKSDQARYEESILIAEQLNTSISNISIIKDETISVQSEVSNILQRLSSNELARVNEMTSLNERINNFEYSQNLKIQQNYDSISNRIDRYFRS